MSGALASLTAADLGGAAIKAALERAGVAPDEVDHVIMGQVLMAGQGQVPSRQAAVKAGIPMSVPSVNVNKVCLSGLNSIYLADQMIAAGTATAGMIAKLAACRAALQSGVASVRIVDGRALDPARGLEAMPGTTLTTGAATADIGASSGRASR